MKNLKTFLILVLTIILGTVCFSSAGCEYGNVSSRVGGKTYGFYYMKVVGGGITAEYNVGDNLPYYGVTTEKFAMLDFYDDGTFKILGSIGETVSQTKVEYLDNPACSPVVNGQDLWFVVPDSNAIINYSVKHNRIEFRIGSPKEKAFCHPTDLSIYDNKLFICNI